MKRSFNTHTNQPAGDPTSAQSWLSDDAHLNWLRADATKQLAFFRNSLRSDGGFDILGWDGTALSRTPQEIHTTTRMVHSFAIGKAFGAPDCDTVIDAGVEFIWKQHRDGKHGGYGWSVLGPNLANDRKLAYGHVFVLLAASSAHEAGHPDAQRILEDITEVLDLRFIDSSTGLLVEDFDSDWKTLSKYRGFNSNMHGVEAFNAAFEATGDNHYLKLAGNIIDFFCGDVARGNQWRIPEHFDENWNIDRNYEGNPVFHPIGTTPGHSFELGRLILQHWDLSGRPDNSAPEKARALIDTAFNDAWLPNGGIAYTLDYEAHLRNKDRYWWPVSEAIGAYATLIKLDNKAEDEERYRVLWRSAVELFVDQSKGGWYPEVDFDGEPVFKQFVGKPDIYHSLQACLHPLTNGISHHTELLKAI